MRRIERELCHDDPRLARLLSEPAGRQRSVALPAPERPPMRSSPASRSSPPPHAAVLAFVACGLGLICGGISIGEMGMVFGGVVTLCSLPLITVLVIFANRPG
ncbi:MAG: DUF3040 domain-containing protein [Pseudonocardia sp.]|nr:DUF3040 domain-containing protein [Pseudonocardia sp.]MBO0872135.1 DUF3040 domain-containing protein [Pseudonocardia sp.]